IKFSPTGSIVWMKARSQDNKVEFSISDSGRGIPSDKLETIFERFQQVDTSDARERGGTGLGLAICREIIQQHQGRIWVKSIHGVGSTFFFTLPKPSDSREPVSAEPLSAESLSTEPISADALSNTSSDAHSNHLFSPDYTALPSSTDAAANRQIL
ncbi:MAG: ATP-binding protein, partial [Cyanobacteria bacterium J06554_3]